jgi:hypothetical protein
MLALEDPHRLTGLGGKIPTAVLRRRAVHYAIFWKETHMRTLLAAALVLSIEVPSPTHGQQPPAATESTTMCPMHAMHAEGTNAMQGMQGMQSMAMMGGQGPTMQGPAALFGRPVGALGLTAEQTAELDAILARAREAAFAVLTPEQRASLEAPPAGAEHQH